jgi:hypothetical protein
MNAPVSTTVIAIDIPLAGGKVHATAVDHFEQSIAATLRQLGYVLADQGDLQLTLTISPNAAVGPALQRLAGAISEFESVCPPLKVRGVIHYGLVFPSGAGSETSYMGSAIRSAQSTLRRSVPTMGLAATQEFTQYAARLPSLTVRFEAQTGGAAADGLSTVIFTKQSETGLLSSDGEFVQFLKKRLAEDLGPFAGALVDNARRSVTLAKDLVAALSHEVDDAGARKRFEMEALAYIKSRGSKK